jgi:adenosylcobyric acid synthase
MLGTTIADDVESGPAGARVAGLGWLDVSTVFAVDKVTRRRRGQALGQPLSGYEIHHGLVTRGAGSRPWSRLDDGYGADDEGATDGDGQVVGTTLHGLFDNDGLRRAFLVDVARRRGRAFVAAERSFAAARQSQIDRLADMVEANLDLAAVDALLKEPSR